MIPPPVLGGGSCLTNLQKLLRLTNVNGRSRDGPRNPRWINLSLIWLQTSKNLDREGDDGEPWPWLQTRTLTLMPKQKQWILRTTSDINGRCMKAQTMESSPTLTHRHHHIIGRISIRNSFIASLRRVKRRSPESDFRSTSNNKPENAAKTEPQFKPSDPDASFWRFVPISVPYTSCDSQLENSFAHSSPKGKCAANDSDTNTES